MSYLSDNQDVEYIRETSDKALNLMSLYNIIPTPSNYQVWYDYSSEENLSLNKAIDELIRKKTSFTSIISKNLFERFYSNVQEHHAVTNTGDDIQSELVRISQAVNDINKGTAKYSSSLGESLLGISDLPEDSNLKKIITNLLTSTNEIVHSNNSAQKKLEESAKTVQKLQTALETVRMESLTDVLTNIGNRKFFEENIKSTIEKSRKDNSELCLIISDIDHFKKFNDTWGHHVGDQVLKAVAHTLKTSVGNRGSTARYGGEEFVIILPDTDLDEALALAEKIRQSIAGRVMKRKSSGENIGKISCSFGIAKYRNKEHRNQFLERADAALYRSKSNGRNRVSLEDETCANIIKIA